MAQSALGDYEEAGPRLERGVALAEEISTLHQEGKVRTDRSMEAETLLVLGDTLAAQGRDDACDAWQQAYLIFSAARLPQSGKLRDGC